MKKINILNSKDTLLALALFVGRAEAASALNLEEYLQQVKTHNTSFSASSLTAEAASEKTADAEMVYQPNVFATIQSTQDKKELSPVAQRGSETDYLMYQAGVSKLTEWGTAAKIYYTTSKTSIKDTNPAYVPEPTWYDASPTLEISQPLLKNRFGQDLKKSIELQQAQGQLSTFTEGLKRKMTLSEAEGAYWHLVIARDSVRTAKENLERANKIIDWNRSRVRSELADAADLIQAEALHDVRDIELTMALDEERAASHAFNTARGSNESVVKEELLKITPELIAKIPVPARSGDREDLKAALLAEKLTDLGMGLSDTKYDASLDVFAAATLNSRDADSQTKAISGSTKTTHPTWSIGLKLSAPIGGDTTNRLRGAWAKDKQAANLIATRKRYEIDREWADLVRKLDESKSRLNLVQRVEDTQRRKLDAERGRQKRGRSTMFQVTQYETDFALSQLNVIRNKAEILGIIARMKTFGGEG